MPVPLEDSYDFCHGLMRSAARNFYYGMRLLPLSKRRAMHALYSFMRLCDDLADGAITDTVVPLGNPHTTDRQQLLEAWRQQTHAALAGDPGAHPIWPAFADMARRFAIPTRYFDEAIDGQLQDLHQKTYATFAELYQYCYRVASTVGLAAVHIWGYADDQALKKAEHLGIAMQLTNILRDLREDTLRGRRYTPAEDYQKFGLPLPQLPESPANDDESSFDLARLSYAGSIQSEKDVITAMHLPSGSAKQVDEFLAFQATRARDYYQQAAGLEDLINTDSRQTLRVMTAIYSRILQKISRQPRVVLFKRVRLSGLEKMKLVFIHALKGRRG